ncbi:hypothetical protein FNV43_RR19974 [Rhamnella rubrinervis]|uniref:SAM dependent carboxyl methyltransferase n=1 Tax=Rhamnella rubrinervis TaxID=2594499 RepID=A0A8K0DYV0_9ROSA|nr:hypothetical protein FNV43_RR19974 [Rhamnella rubrinervis]
MQEHEVVHGGLVALILTGCPNETLHSEIPVIKATELLGSCLMDLAKNGVISEEKVDSFNMPTFFPSMQQLEAAVKRNGCFSIEMVDIKTQPLPQPKTLALSTVFRSGFEGVIRKHFGDEFDLDELFDLLSKKYEESFSTFDPKKAVTLFVLLKRKDSN